jgi:hypothetical protein
MKLIQGYICKKDWEKMPVTEKGRYCSFCRKEVVDLTAPELPRIPEGSFCARYRSSDTVAKPVSYDRHLMKNHFLRFLLLSLSLFYSKFSQAFTIGPSGIPSPGRSQQANDSLKQVILTGSVKNHRQENIGHASIVLECNRVRIAATVSDIHENFVLEVSDSIFTGSGTLKISAMGYENMVLTGIRPRSNTLHVVVNTRDTTGMTITGEVSSPGQLVIPPPVESVPEPEYRIPR